MSPYAFVDLALTPGLSLLPREMDTPAARAMVLAIALQETDLSARRQHGDGPARGYCQFERGGGVKGVLTHPASRAHAMRACRDMDIAATPESVWPALEFCDPLAVVFARLLLWTDPAPLPDRHGAGEGWRIYLRTWRPGKPHPAKWAGAFGVGWDVISPEPAPPKRRSV